MSSQAAVIRVAESLIPLPPEAFPKNLSRTGREDAPETMFPILAYDGQNILPTPWGYRSYFATNEKLLKDSVARLLSNVRCENIFWYQSAQLDNVLVALASDGIYITNTDIDTDWVKVVNLAAFDTDPLVRRQWSFCTINNITFMYLQGTSAFYGLVDSARYAEAATPTIITGATVSQVAINWNVGVLSYTPTFLNMAGQLGIFKAGNRLGFWDSDTSVSWSSALYVEDFTPSVTTLAGFSKFVDVVGGITKICQHGDGFIIYCTRSIVGVTNNINEKSKFSGRAILSNVGVLFDRQIAVAQPDSLHYVLTSSGLYTITNFNPEVIATDILDGLVEANNYLSLDFVDGRYLFINTINGWESSVIEVEAETNEDFEGNKYVFPPVVYPNPEDTSDLVGSYLAGQNQLIQDAFKDYEPVDSPPHELPEDKVLTPCYDISIFNSTWAETTYVNNPQGTELLDSKLKLGVTYFLNDLYGYPTVTVNSITDENILPGDFAGQEAAAKLTEGMTAVNNQISYQQAWIDANATATPVQIVGDDFTSGPPPSTGIAVWEKRLIERRVQPNCVSLEDAKIEATECRTHLYLDKDRLMETLVYFEGTESTLPAGYAFRLDSMYRYSDPIPYCTKLVDFPPESPWLPSPICETSSTVNPASLGYSLPSWPQCIVIVPRDFSTISAFAADWLAVTGFPFVGSVADNTYYMAWCIYTRPNLCTVIGAAPDTLTKFIEIQDFEAELWIESGYTPGSGGPGILALHPKFTIPSDTAWWIKYDGGVWEPSDTEVPIGDPWPWVIRGAKYPFQYNPNYGNYVEAWVNENFTTNYASTLGGVPISVGTSVDYVSPDAIFTPSGTRYTNEYFNYIKDLVSGASIGTAVYLLEGTITREMALLPNFPAKLTVFDMELSGFGYYPSGGFSFRKTHNRHSSTSCPVPLVSFGAKLPTITPPTITTPDYDINDQVTPPYQWEYPPFINLPPNYWLTKKGSAAPLFPTFIRSLVYDSQLEKWGISNMLFKAISSISPVNRSDKTIAPKHDYGMLAAILAPDGSVAIISPNNTASEITYGKLGQYRLGKTKMAYLKFHFKEKFTGTLIVETSLDGRTVAPELTKAADFTDVLSARFPFTLTGEWFNMKVRGSFTLCHIEAFIEGRSRR